ncbi:hypothetical protein CDAR_263611 [Caerostris darwini]|uniref:Uncharacterized protein n=1 Tax=Caerostris darwini TaxID=1538125 RepID=A0AAV4RZ97_9ARAC|nr:hypothetical protein CDAR_263611 [Caerostris darwini]
MLSSTYGNTQARKVRVNDPGKKTTGSIRVPTDPLPYTTAGKIRRRRWTIEGKKKLTSNFPQKCYSYRAEVLVEAPLASASSMVLFSFLSSSLGFLRKCSYSAPRMMLRRKRITREGFFPPETPGNIDREHKGERQEPVITW